jgi:hypothetical protein
MQSTQNATHTKNTIADIGFKLSGYNTGHEQEALK